METFAAAVEEGRNSHVKGQITLVGPDDTFNLNPMLLHNISKSPYFIKCCTKINDWASLVDEIYYEVKHMEPWTAGATKVPSTAFCLMVRLFTLRCTEKQMASMLNHPDSPYIRCIGFLYLRYATEPSDLYRWFSPYFFDTETVQTAPSQPDTTVGEYARNLLTDMNYCNGTTLLPRLPVSIQRDLKVKLLQVDQIEMRAKHHKADGKLMSYFSTVGSRVRALYGDEQNPITWYDGVIDLVIKRDDNTGLLLSRPKFKVTFPEYGNTEIVTLGEMEMPGDDYDAPQQRYNDTQHYDRRYDGRHDNGNNREYSSHDHQRHNEYNRSRNYHNGSSHQARGYIRDDKLYDDHHRSRSYQDGRRPERSCSRDRGEEDNLMEQVRRQERETSTAKGKAYSQRPATFKNSLSIKSDGGTKKRGNSALDYEQQEYKYASRKSKIVKPETTSVDSTAEAGSAPSSPISSEKLAAIEEKKRKLMAKYG